MKSVLLAIALVLSSLTVANACDLKSITFGSNTETIIKRFNIDTLDINITGEAMVSSSGENICNNLPEDSIAEFVFIDNQLVEIKLHNENKSQELLMFALKQFGENDDKDRSKNRYQQTTIALWNKDKDYSAIYSLSIDDNSQTELLNMSSKNHNVLFEKIAKERGKEIDRYLKRKNLGKYSSDYKKQDSTNPNSPSNSGTTTKDDGNGLKALKQKFDRAQEKYKSKKE